MSYTTKIIKLLVILICVLMSIVIFTLFISDDLEGISLLMIVAFYIFSAVVYSLIDFVNIMSVKLKQTANKCFKIACNKSKRKKIIIIILIIKKMMLSVLVLLIQNL